MTQPDNKKSDRSRDEVLAGEYVLGVLPLAERLRVEHRIRQDKAFARIVDRWQANLADFNGDYAPQQAPAPWMLNAIENRLFASGARPSTPFRALWASVSFWRGLAVVSLAAALFVAGTGSGLFGPRETAPRLLATLTPTQSQVSLVMAFDRASGRLSVTPVAAGGRNAKSLELWLIDGSAAPVPLGVLPDTGNGDIVIPQGLRNSLTDGMTLAVSLEPYGGSPTKLPTGPVLATARIGEI